MKMTCSCLLNVLPRSCKYNIILLTKKNNIIRRLAFIEMKYQ